MHRCVEKSCLYDIIIDTLEQSFENGSIMTPGCMKVHLRWTSTCMYGTLDCTSQMTKRRTACKLKFDQKCTVFSHAVRNFVSGRKSNHGKKQRMRFRGNRVYIYAINGLYKDTVLSVCSSRYLLCESDVKQDQQQQQQQFVVKTKRILHETTRRTGT